MPSWARDFAALAELNKAQRGDVCWGVVKWNGIQPSLLQMYGNLFDGSTMIYFHHFLMHEVWVGVIEFYGIVLNSFMIWFNLQNI